MAHGFFIIMGGFHLFERGSIATGNNDQFISQEDDIPLHPLAARNLYRYDALPSFRTTARIEIDFSSFTVPTRAEIKDRGKSDWLAKSLVLLQISWFVMQCIARAIEHLPVAHLEIVTLAYAAMNFVIYIFWWNKPLDVNRPVRVFRKSNPGVADNGIDSHGAEGSRPSEMHPQPILQGRELTREAIGLETIFQFIVGTQDRDVDLSREDRVPMFWANSIDDSGDVVFADIIVLGVGVCFGAIHCIAWHFSFPTHAELLIWRISCVAITAVPVYFPLMVFFFGIGNIIGDITVISVFPAGILYILARVFTLVLAFTSLRDLPPGAYETVHWTTFIPHI